MTTAFTEGSLLVRSLGWTLLHSLWQGAIVAACLGIVFKTLTNTQARLKYHLSLVAMFILAGWFAITWVHQWERLQSVVVLVTEEAHDVAARATHVVNITPVNNVMDALILKSLPQMEAFLPWIVAFYGIGILLMLIRFGNGIARLRQLRTRNIVVPPMPIQQIFSDVKERLQLIGPVGLFLSVAVQVPMVIGFFKPVVLLPFSMVSGLSSDQLEAILIHELAHIKRRDYLINILQTIIETILFFNPFVWWISAGIRREREHCCDDLVLAETLQPLPYATALAALEAHRYAAQSLALAAAGSNKYHLLNRIKRFTEMKRTPLNYSKVAAGILTIGLLTGAAIWLTPAIAQDKNPKQHSTTTKVQKIIVIDDQGNKKEYGSIDELPVHEQKKLHESMAKANEDLDGLDQQPGQMDTKLDNIDSIMSSAQIQTVVKNAMQSIDWSAIRKTTGEAIAKAGSEMNKVDWDKVDAGINSAMKEIDAVDWDAVADAAKEGKSGREMKADIRRQVNEARREAHEAMEDAHAAYRKNLQELPEPPMPPMKAMAKLPPMPPMPPMLPKPTDDYSRMLSQMDQDGLIEQDGKFTISKNSSDLYINGREQPDAVKVKYRKYFSPGNVDIKGNNHNLSISENRSN